jgi:hypothetical protein
VAQTAPTNDAIIKMVKAGLGEDLVLSSIKGAAWELHHRSRRSDRPQESRGHRQNHRGDDCQSGLWRHRGIARVLRTGLSPAAPAPQFAVGVYYNKADAWTDRAAEVANFKTGAVLKTIATPVL